MPYSAIRNSLVKKFEEHVWDHNVLPNADRQGKPSARAGGHTLLALRDVSGASIVRVPLYYQDRFGEDADVWPAISFSLFDEMEGQHYVRGAKIRKTLGTAFQHDTRSRKQRSGPLIVEETEHPEACDLYYEFVTWATDLATEELLRSLIKEVLPSRGTLTYELKDGSFATVDMIRTNGPTPRGGLDPTIEPGHPGSRFWSSAFTYVVEAYDDNSLSKRQILYPTIQQRVFGIGPGNAIEDFSPDTPGET